MTKESRRETVSATMPVGTSHSVMVISLTVPISTKWYG